VANENEQTIKLSAQIDQSFNSMLGLMDSMKSKAMEMASSVSESAAAVEGFANSVEGAESQLQKLGNSSEAARQRAMLLAGIFAAATTAIYKFAKGIFDTELSLQKMAKQQKKTTEAVRASENALQAMGKTLKEVKADKELNKTYQELVKINEQMAMPNINNTIEGLKSLRGAFWELRATAKNVLDWIGARVLTQIEEPVKRITDKLRGVAKWLQNNLDSITMKISSYITGFIKGVEGIVEGFTGILETVNEIDPAIRKIGEAIIFVMGLIKSGPIGQILFLITAIGGVIDDMNNYQRNQRLGLTPDNPTTVVNGQTYQYTETAFTGMWDFLLGPQNEGRSVSERVSGVFEMVLEAVNNKLGEIRQTLSDFSIWDLFIGDAEGVGGIFGAVTSYIGSTDGQSKIIDLARNIIGTLTGALGAGGRLTAELGGLIATMFAGNNPALTQAIEEAAHGNSVSSGIGAGLILKLLGVSDVGSIIGGIVTMFTEAREDAMKQVIRDPNWTDDEYGQKVTEQMLTNMGVDFTSIATLIFEGLKAAFNALEAGSDLVGGLLQSIISKIFSEGSNEDQIARTVSEEITKTGFWKSFFTGMTVKTATGSDALGIFAGLAEAFKYYSSAEGMQTLQDDINTIRDAFETIWMGTWADEAHTMRSDNGLRKALEPLWQSLTQGLDEWWNGANGQDGFKNRLSNKLDEFLNGVDDGHGGKTGGLKNFLFEDLDIDSIFGDIFGKIAQLASEWSQTIMQNLFSAASPVFQDFLRLFGDDPSSSSAKKDAQGNVIVGTDDKGNQTVEIVSSSGETATVPKSVYDEFEPFFKYTTIRNGKFMSSGELTGNQKFDEFFIPYLNTGIEHNWDYSGDPWGWTPLGTENVQNNRLYNFKNDPLSPYSQYAQPSAPAGSGSSGSPGGAGANVGKLTMDTSEAEEKINELESRTPETRASLLVGNDEVTPALEEIPGEINILVNMRMGNIVGSLPNGDKGSGGSGYKKSGPRGAFGGRIGREINNLTAGEDGPEYLIPITKPSRAAELIKQMFGEMGTSAVSKIIGDLGIGAGGNTIGADYASIASAMGSSASVTNNNTVTAPININVQASGVGAEDVGERAYDAAQRHLLRTLRGVFA